MARGDWHPAMALHPQCDHENAMKWGEFVQENPYVENQGRLWVPPKGLDSPENS